MDWNFETLPAPERYKLLTGLVVPRPIALVTTISAAGVVNAAPFSFFNVLGEDPPILVISVGHRGEHCEHGELKDTARNIVASGEFVVHLVDEAIAEQMHGCSLVLPPEASEVDRVGFTTTASRTVTPPRIAEAPAALECRLHSRVQVGKHDLFIGRILWVHAREGLVDPETLRARMENYRVIGRLSGNRYSRTQDRFTVEAGAYEIKA